MKRPPFRSALLLLALGSALVAHAGTHLIDFDLPRQNDTLVGTDYFASDGVTFVNGRYLGPVNSPSPPNVLYDDVSDTITMNSSTALISGVGVFYASNGRTSSSTGFDGSLSVYSGLGGTGTLLSTVALADVATFSSASVSFAGEGHSIVLHGVANHIEYDDLSFTTAVPGPLAAMPFALGLLRRRRKPNPKSQKTA